MVGYGTQYLTPNPLRLWPRKRGDLRYALYDE